MWPMICGSACSKPTRWRRSVLDLDVFSCTLPRWSGEVLRMRRVVVTGMGIVSSIGNNTQEVLASLREAKSGVVRADKYAELGFRSQVHGAPTLDARESVDRRAMRFLGGGAAWNHVAMEQAIRDAGLEQTEV